MSYWEIKLKNKDVGEIFIYGEIASVKYFEEDTTPATISAELKALGDVKTLNIYINSGGGSAFAGFAIFNILKRHNAKKVVYVDGLAASAASIIAMAGDEIAIPKNAFLMIHKSWGISVGDSDKMLNYATSLEKIDLSMIGIYMEKTKLSEEKIKELIKAETWMKGDEAVKMGFATKLIEDKKVAASIKDKTAFFNGIEIDLKQYRNFPADKLPEKQDDLQADNELEIINKIIFS